MKYNSVEHAYQRAKIVERSLESLSDEQVAIINKKLASRGVKIGRDEVLQFFSDQDMAAGTSKIVGNQLRILGFVRDDWDHVKLPIMTALLIQKFSYPHLYSMLSDTGDQDLVEGNDWGDTFWGVVENRGRNVLGRLLMILRSNSFAEVREMKKVVDQLGIPNYDTTKLVDPVARED